jgi:hypothetical protein
MSGPMVHVGAQVLCSHGGQATPMVPNPRVLVGGQPTVLLTSTYAVAGCAMPPPPNGNGPCVTGQWLSGSVRTTSNGQPFVLQFGSSVCAPTGTPLIALQAQTRVIAT